MRHLRLRPEHRHIDEEHHAHLPHEEPTAWVVSAAIAAAVGILVVGATFALFG